MGSFTWKKPATRDDPIYKEGLTVFTPKSARGSTPSTESSPKSTASDSNPVSKAPQRPETTQCIDQQSAGFCLQPGVAVVPV